MINRKVMRSLLAYFQLDSNSEFKLWDRISTHFTIQPAQSKLVPIRIKNENTPVQPNNHHY